VGTNPVADISQVGTLLENKHIHYPFTVEGTICVRYHLKTLIGKVHKDFSFGRSEN
jgi:hypothetical protein